MSDEPSTAEPEVPEWVHEMRAKGYTVRVGTNTRGLPYYPEISYHDFESPRANLRRRFVEFVILLRSPLSRRSGSTRSRRLGPAAGRQDREQAVEQH